MITRRFFVRTAVCVLGLFATLGSTPSATAGTPIKVGHNLWIGFGPAYVAKEKGIFEKHGLDVELVAFAGPGDSLPPLIAGHIDLTMSCPDNVVLLHGTSDDATVSVFQIDTSAGADGIVAKKEIKTPADLKGKKVAATIGQVNHLLMLLAIQSGGLTEADVEIVNMNADDAGAAFIAGTLDAAATWEPWLSKAAAANGHIIYSSKDAPGILGDCLVATRATASGKPDIIKAYIESLDEAVKFVAANKEESYAITGKYLGVKPEEAADMYAKVHIFTLDENKVLFGPVDKPGPQYAAMKKIGDFMLKQGVIKTSPDPMKMIVPTYVQDMK